MIYSATVHVGPAPMPGEAAWAGLSLPIGYLGRGKRADQIDARIAALDSLVAENRWTFAREHAAQDDLMGLLLHRGDADRCVVVSGKRHGDYPELRFFEASVYSRRRLNDRAIELLVKQALVDAGYTEEYDGAAWRKVNYLGSDLTLTMTAYTPTVNADSTIVFHRDQSHEHVSLLGEKLERTDRDGQVTATFKIDRVEMVSHPEFKDFKVPAVFATDQDGDQHASYYADRTWEDLPIGRGNTLPLAEAG